MRAMGLQAISGAPVTSQDLDKVHVSARRHGFTRPNQVWAADITYVPMTWWPYGLVQTWWLGSNTMRSVEA